MPRALSKVYFHPETAENASEIDKLFDALTETEPVVEHRPLQVWGRDINVPLSTKNVARFTFDELCGKPLSAADYLEITKTFETIFITGVPLLGLDTKDMARRFILFIDAAYEVSLPKAFSPSATADPSFLRRPRFASPPATPSRAIANAPLPADKALHPLRTTNSLGLLGREVVDWRDHGPPAERDGRPWPLGRVRRRELDLHGRGGDLCVCAGSRASFPLVF